MTKSEAIAAVSREQTRLIQLSDAIWDHPQVKYQETFAAGLLSDFLREEGFTMDTGVAGIPTAFCASYGSGAPVIGLLAGSFDYVVIDGEAGVEQINRRVMEKVTHLLLITDASRKGTQVIQTVKKVADELVMYDQVGAIVNRLPSREVIPLLDTGDIPVLSYIENDAALADFDIRGENVFYLPEEANIVRGVKEALEKLGV